MLAKDMELANDHGQIYFGHKLTSYARQLVSPLVKKNYFRRRLKIDLIF